MNFCADHSGANEPGPAHQQTDCKTMSSDKPKKRPLSPVRKEQNRREFIRTSLLAGGTLVAALAGYIPIAAAAPIACARQAL